MMKIFDLFNKNDKNAETVSFAFNSEILRQKGDLKTALKMINKALKLNDNNSDYYLLSALIKKDLNDLTGALNDINKSIDLNADYNKAYIYRYMINKLLKRENDAENDIKILETGKYTNNLPSLFEKMSDDELRLNHIFSAEIFINKAFLFNPQNEKILLKKIEIEKRNKKFKDALNDAKILISLDENNEEYCKIKEELQRISGVK